MTSYNYSRLRLLDECEAAFALYGERPPTNLYVQGTAVHKALDEYFKYCARFGVERDMEKAREFAESNCDYLLVRDEARDEAVRMVEYAAATHSAKPPPGWTAESERQFFAFVAKEPGGMCHVRPGNPSEDDLREWVLTMPPKSKGWIVRGTLDYLWSKPAVPPIYGDGPSLEPGAALVWDWKSDHSLAGGSKLNRELQARIYGLLASLAAGCDSVEVRWEFLRFGVSRSATLASDDLDAVAMELVALLERAETAKSAPDTAVPGSWCASCPVFHACPASRTALEHWRGGDFATPADFLLVKRSVEDYEQTLRRRVREQGQAAVNEREEFRFDAQERREAKDAGAVVAALRARGYEDEDILAQFASFSVSKLEKAFRGNGMKGRDVEDAMREVSDEAHASVFRLVERKGR